ncbi:MAG: hypothetical protein ACI90V_005989, partial [Bacillariaceae sp.]
RKKETNKSKFLHFIVINASTTSLFFSPFLLY